MKEAQQKLRDAKAHILGSITDKITDSEESYKKDSILSKSSDDLVENQIGLDDEEGKKEPHEEEKK